ncbi:MAG: hypothetical protein IJ027_00165 [Oscillospiraceae bacterium]|nr:hypothetical protein [Oscillospiraceae bacterium]
MPNYKKMYFTLLNGMEDAINILIAAQQKCEDLYCDDNEIIPLEILKKENDEGN